MITLTTNAVKQVYGLMEAADDFNLKLRVYIIGGGCSGFQYGFAFEEKYGSDEWIFTQKVPDLDVEKEISAVVDPISMQYLDGAIIDYENTLQGSRFVVKNPNAVTTCGCGSSFSV